MAKKLLHRCICAHMYFWRRVCMHLDHVCTLHGCCEHQRTHLLTRSLQDVHMLLCMCSLFVQCWGNEDGRFQLVYEGTCCLAWGVIFDRMKDRGVVCVFSVFKFNAGGSVCGCMCVYTHTHTHTHCTDELLGCEPRSRDETSGGPEESRWTKSWHTYIRICVQSTHYIYAKWPDEILDKLLFSFNMSFLFRKVEDVTTISKSQSLTLVGIKDCTLRVPNKTTTLFLYEQ